MSGVPSLQGTCGREIEHTSTYKWQEKNSKGGLRHCHLGSENGFKVDITRKLATH